MELIKIKSGHDKLLELVDDMTDISEIEEIQEGDDIFTKLTFPFCGQRCFNTISTFRTKVSQNKGDSVYAAAQSWELSYCIILIFVVYIRMRLKCE